MNTIALLSTPVPPADLVYLVVGHRDLDSFAFSRREGVNVIVGLLEQVGRPIATFRSILDFGCGCGRLLAGWEGVLHPAATLDGCDINADLATFCQQNIRGARVLRSNFMPPLPYDDEAFDLLYAISVYTHMTVPAMLQWTGEFARILRPGGIALVTMHGSYYAAELAKISPEGSRLHAERGYHVHQHANPDENWKGSNSYAAFATPDFMRRLFIGFDLLAAFPGISHGPTPLVSYQDVMLFCRR